MKIGPKEAEEYLNRTLNLTERLITSQIAAINRKLTYEYRMQKFNQLVSIAYFALIIGTPLAFYYEMGKIFDRDREYQKSALEEKSVFVSFGAEEVKTNR